MKKPVFLFLLIVCTFQLRAQNTLLDKKVSLSCRQMTLSAVLEQLQRDYAVAFSYFNQPAALHKYLSVQVKEQALKAVLDQLLAGTNIQYQVVGQQVVLKETSPVRSFSLKGKVVDKVTLAPLAAASVSVAGTDLGTVTNAEGQFSLSLPGYYREYRLAISFVGYQTAFVSMAALKNEEVRVELEPQTQVLNEVVVEEKGGFALLPKNLTDLLKKYRVDTIQVMDEWPLRNNGITVQGKIKDRDTQKPVVFSKILLPDQQSRLASDISGEFQFSIQARYAGDTLVFSSLIYQEVKVPVAVLREPGATVWLPRRKDQEEAVIAKLRDTRVLADKGIALVSANYANQDARLQAQFREVMKASGTNTHFINLEAQFEIFKPAYQERDRKGDQMRLISGRQQKLPAAIAYDGRSYEWPYWIAHSVYTLDGLDVVKGYSKYFDVRPFLIKTYHLPPTETDYQFNPDSFLTLKQAKSYQMELVDLISYRGEQVFVLAFEPLNYWKSQTYFQGRLFIDVQTLAFIRVEYQLTPGGILSFNTWDTPVELKKRSYVVNYTKDQDRWCFEKGSIESEYWYIGTKVFLNSRAELEITQREMEGVQPFKRKELLRDSYKPFVKQIKTDDRHLLGADGRKITERQK